MDQCSGLTFGSVPQIKGWELDDSAPRDPFYSASGGIYIPRFQNLDTATHSKFKRGFAFQGTVGRGYVNPGNPAMFRLMSFGETLPYFDNRVTLNPRRTDAWGIPIARVRCALTANEHALLQEQMKSVHEMVDACGYKIDFSGSTLGLENEKEAYPNADWFSRFLFGKNFKKSMAVGAAIHECGGVRMGVDPKNSLLNSYNQSWDVKNLFVTDGSSFPTCGTVGPALTIMALTARTCDYIAREYKTGSL